jgi:uncharacterized membrane protein
VPFAGDRRRILSPLVGVLLIGLVLLLPDIAAGIRGQTEVVEAYRGEIVSIQAPAADADPDTPPVPIAKVRMLEGPQAGQTIDAYLSGPGGSQSVADYRPGESVVVTVSDNQDGTGPFVSVSDRWRLFPLEILVLLFAVVIVVVGGWHGLRALIALGLTIAVILKILIPLLIWGAPPVPLAVIAASGVTVVTILLTEGWNRSSLAAILGTTGAIAITGLLAAAATAAMGFSYTAGSDLAFLTTANGQGLDLRGVLLAAFILGAVGVLDDVTVTQAVLVAELAEKGQLRGSRLFTSGMAIGRSHIAATVNTLFLAYVGAGLPLLVLLVVSRQPGAIVFNDELIATEIVRTVVGGLGIVAAVPLTTFIATSLVGEPGAAGSALRPGRRIRTAASAGGIIAGLLVLTAALPLTSGPRSALTPDVFQPSTGPVGTGPSPDASSLPTEPRVFGANEPVPITLDEHPVGTITVVGWTVDARDPPSTDATISVDVRYVATAPFALDAGSWEILLADGTEVPLSPRKGTLTGILASGETRDARLTGTFTVADEAPFIAYVDRATDDFAFFVSVE